MIHVAIACTRYARTMGSAAQDCNPPTLDMAGPHDEVTAEQVRQFLAEHDWATDADGNPYCPRHNPADAGTPWQPPFPDGQYHPIYGTGWEARSFIGSNSLEIRPVNPVNLGRAATDVLSRLDNAERRLEYARQVLIEDGYFTDDEVSDDIAPRLIEWLSHMRGQLDKELPGALLEALDQLRVQVKTALDAAEREQVARCDR